MKRNYDIDNLILVQNKRNQNIYVFRILGCVNGFYHMRIIDKNDDIKIDSKNFHQQYNILCDDQKKLKVFWLKKYQAALIQILKEIGWEVVNV